MQNLRGVLLPFPTPFDEQEELDLQSLRANVEKWNETGIKGYVALGSTGERVHLDEEEAIKVIGAAREAVPGDLAFIVGAGRESVRGTVREVNRLKDAGADAVLLITPHFYRSAMTQSALTDYYLHVADAAHLPILLYSMPELTGITLLPETVVRLSEHENIIGIKDSSGDIINLAETLRLVPKDFAVMTGNGALLFAALGAGATGAILAVGCVAPRVVVEIYRAAQSKDYERGLDLQKRLTPIARAVTARFGIGGLKAALEMCGYACGRMVRAPLSAASVEARQEIARLIRDSELFDQELFTENVENTRPLPQAVLT